METTLAQITITGGYIATASAASAIILAVAGLNQRTRLHREKEGKASAQRLDDKLDARFSEQDAKSEARTQRLEDKMDERFDKSEARAQRLEDKMDERFREQSERLRNVENNTAAIEGHLGMRHRGPTATAPEQPSEPSPAAIERPALPSASDEAGLSAEGR